ncbi:MAG: hypothetical protein SYR96_37405 [Actinomycetota bacterium]|nr:hypothetical protein [Actinomycetota bacterium]
MRDAAPAAPKGERFGGEVLRAFVEIHGLTETTAVSALTDLLTGFDEVDDDVAVMAFSVSGN